MTGRAARAIASRQAVREGNVHKRPRAGTDSSIAESLTADQKRDLTKLLLKTGDSGLVEDLWTEAIRDQWVKTFDFNMHLLESTTRWKRSAARTRALTKRLDVALHRVESAIPSGGDLQALVQSVGLLPEDADDLIDHKSAFVELLALGDRVARYRARIAAAKPIGARGKREIVAMAKELVAMTLGVTATVCGINGVPFSPRGGREDWDLVFCQKVGEIVGLPVGRDLVAEAVSEFRRNHRKQLVSPVF